ncbi:carbohydrate ABC transporter substrate-binding protein (CUT1 family) [Terracoccus luteus]|jgi:multiple sugar transport system substrate-binding protein|uniref:Carbohydrate ABC transporter substrate-binding protein (CUT1 family) n=1 Tax=Terracoccus luteus TaxID=53356 RepID=A0A495XRV8_9MICO|nr:extracellular solute-binding protein [Terracoccus luteus]RKT76847.1 carbohydrate ABC transporter substrate-binding protein (CUT1 family) [Terracoccus luteus]
MRARLGIAAAAIVTMVAGCAGVGGGTSGGDGGGGGASGGGGLSGTPSGTLRIMGFGGEDEVGQSRIKAFKDAYPGVTVSNNKGDFDAQQFLTALASGNPPDLVYMDRNLIGTYAQQGAVVPLEDCISSRSVDTSQYREAAMRSVTLGGKVYGIPEFYVVTTTLVDGKSLASAGMSSSDLATTDWASLKTASDKLYKASGGKIERIGFDPKLPEYFPLWATANGAQIIKEDGSPNLNDPKAVEALEFAISLVDDQGGWTSFKSFRDAFDIFGEKNPLSAGAVVAFPMENWYVNVLRDYIGSGLKLESVPFTDRQGKPVSMVGGSAWAIPKGSKNATAACAWAQTMTDKATWLKAAEARVAKVKQDNSFFTGLFTANKPADDAIRDQYLTDAPDPGFKQAIDNYYSTLDVAQALNPSAAGSQIDAAWKSGVSRALAGTPVKDALDQAQKEAEAAFTKAKG